MPETTGEFHIGVILSVTDGRLLTRRAGPKDNGIGELYRLLGHMTGEPPFTHQLPRFMAECRPWLIRQHPWLDGPEMRAELESLTEGLEAAEGLSAAGRERFVAGWLEKVAARFGEFHRVERIPMDDHDRIDPVEELINKVGRDRVIVVAPPETED